jgi:hypothetical protein
MQASFVKFFHIEIVLLLFFLPIVAIYDSMYLAIIFSCFIFFFILLFFAACHCRWLQEYDEVSPGNIGDRSSDGGGTMAD